MLEEPVAIPDLSPYPGLRPFREADGPFFFGRERDIRIIAANLVASPLTVLYGPSGVGKSSVLQAGVIPAVRESEASGVLYFNEWQDASFLDTLNVRCREALTGPATGALDEILRPRTGPFYLLLDQFEEYLLYHPDSQSQDAFEGLLARLVNRNDGSTRILIGIREDALFRLDERLSLRIPNLLENTLQLRHLTVAAAREAIEQPVRIFNETLVREGRAAETLALQPALVDALLEQMPAPGGHIETAYLQLVLSRIWTVTRNAGSRTLSFETLRAMGGASKIVDTHVQRVMDGLSDQQRTIAARLFGYLVTPSRSKIAQTGSDLIEFGEAEESEVRRVLSALTDSQDSRILRRLSSPERYELFHDVLAQPILDWRRGFLEGKKREDARQAQAAARIYGGINCDHTAGRGRGGFRFRAEEECQLGGVGGACGRTQSERG